MSLNIIQKTQQGLKSFSKTISKNKGKVLAGAATIGGSALAGAGVGAAAGAVAFGIGAIPMAAVGAVIGLAGGTIVVGGIFVGHRVIADTRKSQKEKPLAIRNSSSEANQTTTSTERKKLSFRKSESISSLKKTVRQYIASPVFEKLEDSNKKNRLSKINNKEASQKTLQEIETYPSMYSPTGHNNNCGPVSVLFVLFKALEHNKDIVNTDALNKALDEVLKNKDLHVGKTEDVETGATLLKSIIEDTNTGSLDECLLDPDNYLPLTSTIRSLIKNQILEKTQDKNQNVIGNDTMIPIEHLQNILKSFNVTVPFYARTPDGTNNHLYPVYKLDSYNLPQYAIYLTNFHYNILEKDPTASQA